MTYSISRFSFQVLPEPGDALTSHADDPVCQPAPETGRAERSHDFMNMRTGLRGIVEGMAPRARAFHAGAAQGKPLHDRQQLFKQYEALKALDENALAQGLEKFLKVAAGEGEPGVRQSALALAMLQFKRVPEDRKGDVVIAFLKAGMSLSQLETMTRRLIQRDGESARRQVVQVVVRLCVDSPHAALTMVLRRRNCRRTSGRRWWSWCLI